MNAIVKIKKERNYQSLLAITEFNYQCKLNEANRLKEIRDDTRKKFFEQIVRGYYQIGDSR